MPHRLTAALALMIALAWASAAAPAGGDRIVSGGPDGPQYVIPAGNPTGAPTFGHGEDINARFAGQWVLTGTLHYDGDADNRLVFLQPDADIAARLPHWKEGGRPREIWFEIGEDVVRAVFGASAMTASESTNRIHADNRHVALDVDRYTISIECDAANYTVHFLRVHQPGIVAQNVEMSDGC